jgi:serine/threonine protein kinase
MPLMKHSLADFIKNGPIDWPTKLNIARGICEGMIYLHSCNLLHRDLKSQNVLLDEDCSAKLIDFGLTRVSVGLMTKGVGTFFWMAPEVILGDPYDREADVYSFAIVLWELIYQKEPYSDLTEQESSRLEMLIVDGVRPTLPKKMSKLESNASKLLKKLWQKEAKKRGSFEEALEDLLKIAHKLD